MVDFTEFLKVSVEFSKKIRLKGRLRCWMDYCAKFQVTSSMWLIWGGFVGFAPSRENVENLILSDDSKNSVLDDVYNRG